MYAQYNFPFGRHSLRLETASPAGEVCLTMGETSILASVDLTGREAADLSHPDLSVTFFEFAIPDPHHEVPSCRDEGRLRRTRFIERFIEQALSLQISPGFPYRIRLGVQVLSHENGGDDELLAVLAASAALRLSGTPISGSVGAARVALVNGIFRLNPSPALLAECDLHLLVAGSQLGVQVVEVVARERSPSELLEAVIFGQRKLQAVIDAIDHLAYGACTQNISWKPRKRDLILEERANSFAEEKLWRAYAVESPVERQHLVASAKRNWIVSMTEEMGAENVHHLVLPVLGAVERELLRKRLVSGLPRLDGRSSTAVRPEIQSVLKTDPQASMLMGFICSGAQFIVLADMADEERWLCDVECAVSCTKQGISSVLAVMKVTGISLSILQMILLRALDGYAPCFHIVEGDFDENEVSIDYSVSAVESDGNRPSINAFKHDKEM